MESDHVLYHSMIPTWSLGCARTLATVELMLSIVNCVTFSNYHHMHVMNVLQVRDYDSGYYCTQTHITHYSQVAGGSVCSTLVMTLITAEHGSTVEYDHD